MGLNITDRTGKSLAPREERPLQNRAGGALEGLFGGLFGGLLAWVLVEKTGWFAMVLYGSGSLASGKRLALQIALGGVYGLCVGAGLSVARRDRRNGAWGTAARVMASAVTGAAGGCLGIWVGQLLYDRFLGAANAHDIVTVGLAARCASWGIMGLALGAAQGAARGVDREVGLGALGGFCGGITGGAVFEALEQVTANPPVARLIGFMFVGAAVGFFLEALPLLTGGNKAARSSVKYKTAMTNPIELNDDEAAETSAAAQDSHHAIPAQLVGVEGPYAGIIFPLRAQQADIIVGRLTDCDVCLMNDRTISRRHALLRRDHQTGEFRIEDLRSANGTGVNNVRLHPTRPQTLVMRDLINLGTSTLRFEWVGAPPESYL